ncbi:ATPase, T2SS/T4P/T4SS family [Microbacterium sp. p3-SID336]|uniref:ATPase, T2SS/T4P/T4SS family n=1 Tax=Microbacterium sp. p3-SID336 TaxID=2916212 RepID=UPI0021A9700F|nr:ATPase, T2SS/T4P/T4SS family [Microbacterium sp. p3-SID336]MCT1479133.1 Flp pilus assembly complex ATPase component TadA [Microbacterium sp. p3-SID336]
MTHPAMDIAELVRRRLRAEGIDPAVDPERARSIARAEVRRHDDLALARGAATVEDEAACVRDVLASVSGFGVLQPLLDATDVEEIWVNGDGAVHIARGGSAERTFLRLEEATVRDLVERMLQSTGRRVDIGQPFVDASLPDGSRLHVAIADVVRGSWVVNIRKFLRGHRSVEALVAQGAMTAAVAELLTAAMRDRASVIVSGATHTGNTTWHK